MAYDASTGNVVLFGGASTRGTLLNDTWTWNGSTWNSTVANGAAGSPPARAYATMAYDATTGNTVLFGGYNSAGTLLNDTWTWNGNTWTQMSPSTSPPVRSGASMAYDATTGNVVLFGGYSTGGTLLNDTWTWNGSTWTQVSPSTSPPAREYSTMAYDAATGNVVLFGGYNGATAYSDTWTWNGSTWTQMSPTTSPSARWGASMTYDAATSNVVLFGGIGASGALNNDTWTWNGNTWTQMSPSTSPLARSFATMTYDPATRSTVLFGGSFYASLLNDTWVWGVYPPASPYWAGTTPTTSPPARSGASMAYDAATGNVVLFGGLGTSGALNDTWTWNGSNWTSVTPFGNNPIASYGSSMAYDPSTGSVVLFGGIDASGSFLSDTYSWKANAWTYMTVSNPIPAPRAYAAMSYDARTAQMVLFGGESATGDLSDTWLWDGQAWAQLQPLGSVPSARYGSSMAYDAATTDVVLFGGTGNGGNVADTWTYQPTVTPPGVPTGLAAKSGTGQISLSWSPPTITQSEPPAASYEIFRGTNSDRKLMSQVGTTSSTSYTDTTVTPGVSYYYAIKASNAIGYSLESAETVSVANASAPTAAPTSLGARVASGSVSLTWVDVPASFDGGSAITSYLVEAKSGSTVLASTSVGPGTQSATLTGLQNGTSYTLQVAAVNSIGPGPFASTTATPLGVPGAPGTVLAADSGSGSVTLTWSAPSVTGGSAITSYTVVPTPSCVTCVIRVSGTGASVTGLNNGTAYTFVVVASNAQGSGPISSPSNVVTPQTPPQGYWIATNNGGVLAQNGARFYGSASNLVLNQPIVGMAATPDHRGYWLVARDGGIFAFGDAAFYGSMGGRALNAPIVGMASTRDGKGYYEVASDGGIFAFGDAAFYGSMGGKALNQPVVAVALTPNGGGYWEVASDGGVFSFGDANFYGSTGNLTLNKPVEAISPTPDGGGYWFVASDGGVFSFGDANFYGSGVGLVPSGSVVAMTTDPSGNGYWLTLSTGTILSFGDAQALPGTGGVTLSNPVVAMALS